MESPDSWEQAALNKSCHACAAHPYCYMLLPTVCFQSKQGSRGRQLTLTVHDCFRCCRYLPLSAPGWSKDAVESLTVASRRPRPREGSVPPSSPPLLADIQGVLMEHAVRWQTGSAGEHHIAVHMTRRTLIGMSCMWKVVRSASC
jgi:hypothetical protein